MSQMEYVGHHQSCDCPALEIIGIPWGTVALWYTDSGRSSVAFARFSQYERKVFMFNTFTNFEHRGDIKNEGLVESNKRNQDILVVACILLAKYSNWDDGKCKVASRIYQHRIHDSFFFS